MRKNRGKSLFLLNSSIFGAQWSDLFIYLFIYYYHYYYHYYNYPGVFHVSVNSRSFTGVWVTASLLRSTGLFSVFRLILMLELVLSLLLLRFPTLPASSSSLWGSFHALQLQLVSPSPSYSIVCFFQFSGPSTIPSFRFLCFLFCGPPRQQTPLFGRLSFCLLLSDLVFYPVLGVL